MIEPPLTGISYSFTDDGFFEEAYYRAISNRPLILVWNITWMMLTYGLTAQEPACPKGIMQFQHGTFSKAANGSLTLTPFAVDGRQLLSDPCSYSNAIYTRYNQTEVFEVCSLIVL